MAERLTGIDVREEVDAGHALPHAPTSTTAFIGRTLRGPLNRPLTVRSFADFERAFGGLWQPSTLSYSIEQFFENGGATAVVVRVANGARPCTLSLPAGGEWLRLRAVAPGTREFLRAAVDYDGIGDNEPERFNLVVQRIRSPGSEHIEDQEIYRRLSVEPGSSRFVVAALLESQLVRVAGNVPARRPDATLVAGSRGLAGYVGSSPDGDDGAPPTDYDIIGSASEATGLFALGSVDAFNFLCIPPLARELDVGPSTLLVANRYCRDRRAILLVDPPLDWDTPQAALAGVRDWGFASDSALMYFPRLLALDKLRGRFEAFGPAGAVAGMLARADNQRPPWTATAADVAQLRPGMRPLCPLSREDQGRLGNFGINVLTSVRVPGGTLAGAQTLAGPGAPVADWRLLGPRRLSLFVLNTVEQGTRWMLFEQNGPALWARAESRLRAFFEELEADGAFAGSPPGNRWYVICDERINRDYERERGIVNLLFGFAAARPGQFHSYLLSHRAGGSRLRPLSLDRRQAETGRAEALLAGIEQEPLAHAG